MTREQAIKELKEILPQTTAINMAIKALEQEPCDDWYDIPSDEMTLEQARQAVRDLRKKWAEHLWQEPCEDAVSREQLERELHAQMAVDAISKEVALDMLEHLPSITPQPKTGHWIRMKAYEKIEDKKKERQEDTK
jgi:hypothetical protein